MSNNFFDAYHRTVAKQLVGYKQVMSPGSLSLTTLKRNPSSRIHLSPENISKAKRLGLDTLIKEAQQKKNHHRADEAQRMKIVDREKVGKMITQSPSTYFQKISMHIS